MVIKEEIRRPTPVIAFKRSTASGASCGIIWMR
jgi:hypothetical protein